MKTLTEYKKENKISKKYVGGNYVPRKVRFITTDEVASFFEGSIPAEIEKALQIAKKARILTASIQDEIEKLGFYACFRGFNSHSKDMYAYQESNGKWYFSIGRSNIAQAGRGLEIEI